jgi:hypothetical protein
VSIERTPDLQLAHERLIGELQDLIAALDRCVPIAGLQVERRFVRDAAALRNTALEWLEALRDTRAANR